MDTEARLIELETRLAFQDRTIETLNEVVLQLRNDLLAMGRRIDELRDHLAGAGPETGPGDDRPPHW
jgi:SlyX protein